MPDTQKLDLLHKRIKTCLRSNCYFQCKLENDIQRMNWPLGNRIIYRRVFKSFGALSRPSLLLGWCGMTVGVHLMWNSILWPLDIYARMIILSEIYGIENSFKQMYRFRFNHLFWFDSWTKSLINSPDYGTFDIHLIYYRKAEGFLAK